MKPSFLVPFLFGQKVEVIRETRVIFAGVEFWIPMGSKGRVVRTTAGSSSTLVQLEDEHRHLQIPNLNLLPINVEERIKTRFKRR